MKLFAIIISYFLLITSLLSCSADNHKDALQKIQGFPISDPKSETSISSEYMNLISNKSINPFSETDPKTYPEAKQIFRENVKTFSPFLSEKTVKKYEFEGIVHFGTNTTRQGTAGVAAKPHAKLFYGGTELTWANNQSMLNLIQKDPKIKLAIKDVRKGVNNANISIARLEYALIKEELIFFHLNQFNRPIIEALVQDNANYKTKSGFKPVWSVTGQEFIHIYKNWDRFSHSVIFLRNLKPVYKPW